MHQLRYLYTKFYQMNNGRQNDPPRILLRLFRWYCRPDLVAHIEGDLLEEYQDRFRRRGKRYAQWRLAIDVLKLFRPGIIRAYTKKGNTNTAAMYQSYLKIAWRNLRSNRGYSMINVGGLAIGMAVAMLIGLWVYDELTFNSYFVNHKQIARVYRQGTLNGEVGTTPYLPYALRDELQTKYGEDFKHVVSVWPTNDHIIVSEKENWSLRGSFIQPAGVEMFSLKMREGSNHALDDPHSVIISSSAARTLYGNESALGKTVRIDNTMDATVTGVYEDIPYNAHFNDVRFFASFELIVSANPWILSQGFGNNFLDIYVQLTEQVTLGDASNRIKGVIKENIKDDKEYLAVNPQLFLHPMDKWHLWSDWKNGINSGMIDMVWLFGIVGVFVLLLACINFMNLSTARAEKRAKEIGIRKAIGSARSQLISQFYSESFFVTVSAFVLSMLLTTLALPSLNALSAKQITMPFGNFYFWVCCITVIAVTTLLSGSYPALLLSAFRVTRALKGSFKPGRNASLPRKILVVAQFTVSITLILATIVVYRQLVHAKDRPVGYEREGLITVQINSSEFSGKLDALRTELKTTGAVAEMGLCSSPLTEVWNSNGGFDWEGRDPGYIAEFGTFTVSPEYGKTIGWQFVEGRDFSPGMASDSMAFIINESAARILGFEHPVGQTVKWQSWWTNGVSDFRVIGVVKDQIMRSPYDPAMPSVFFLGGYHNWISIRVSEGRSMADAMQGIQSAFAKVIPDVPVQYKFADQEYALKFASEERVGVLATVFASLAIFISCLGLFALAAFVAEQRTKEIGIRKVVGASVLNLSVMLSRSFLILVAVSCLIAMPLAYVLMQNWLETFTYRTNISWWIFPATAAGALAITLITVSIQALKAALMSPVKSLRSE